jgi:hypothetical protein
MTVSILVLNQPVLSYIWMSRTLKAEWILGPPVSLIACDVIEFVVTRMTLRVRYGSLVFLH